jgi:peptide/nickel transport system substrate-binding protein
MAASGARQEIAVTKRIARYALALIAAPALAIASCGGVSPSSSAGGPPVKGGIVTLAEPAAMVPNYIFPMYSGANWTATNNGYLEPQLFRPLYWFGDNGQPTVNSQLSLANLPVYSNGGRTVTIALKPFKWSDGKPVTTRDVEFWINLLKANKLQYGPYFPGGFPDSVVSANYNSSSSFTLTFNNKYNPDYVLSMLSIITPIPQHAWDKTSATGPVGNYDTTTTGAKAVYKFLNDQSMDLSSYATNPLWKVVDGPFSLKAFTVQGEVTLVPNTRYSGPIKPKISELIEQPYASAAAEFDVLQSGGVTYGYAPLTEFKHLSQLKARGYRTEVWPGWQASWASFNYRTRPWGPILQQQYVRQAMQFLVNQPAIASEVYQGSAYPTYGPVPSIPKSPYVSPYTSRPTYSYSPSKAITLLSSHGWAVHPNGVTTCTQPVKCGPGIPAGAKMSFPLMYVSGDPAQANMFQELQSAFSSAGIQLQLLSYPTGTVLADQSGCGNSCKWAISFGGIGWIYFPYPYPDGGVVWKTGSAGALVGYYSNAVTDHLIDEDQVSSGLGPLFALEDHLAKTNAALWLPTPANQLSEVRDDLSGVTPQDPTEAIAPEYWYFTK